MSPQGITEAERDILAAATAVVCSQKPKSSAAVLIDASALAFALANMEPDLWAPARPGEAWADVIARRDAARDILDDLLVEAAGGLAA